MAHGPWNIYGPWHMVHGVISMICGIRHMANDVLPYTIARMIHVQITAFQQAVLSYYRDFGRFDLPWRQPGPDGQFDPYKILVSEVMLQQTQVPRVVPKFAAFMTRFPSVSELAEASQADVLRTWSGLGYNRRARYLHQAAQAIHRDFGHKFPGQVAELTKLAGIGNNTAAAILVYSYDRPLAFIETNIRTAFIHHFFADEAGISDTAILEIVERALPKFGAREWYWALMDYGAFLKRTIGNPNRASEHYARQSKFEGSARQVRGRVIHLLGAGSRTEAELQSRLADERLSGVLQQLVSEGLIRRHSGRYSL